MRLLIEILFELLKRGLKGALCVSLLAGVARADEPTEADRIAAEEYLRDYAPPAKVKSVRAKKPRPETRLQFCQRMQGASLLGDWEDCIEVLNDAGLLEQTRAELIEDGVDPEEVPDDVK